MDSLTFLEQPASGEPRPVYVIHGDEEFLKRRVRLALRARILGEDGGEFSYSAHPGDKATYAAVIDELETLPFLGAYRLVVVENADPFVTKNRAALEKFVTTRASASGSRGVLVLDVRTWTSTTNLAKMLGDKAAIVCKAPPAYKLPGWCSQWSTAQYQKQLTADAAQLLVDLAGADMGLLDQELAKLAVYVGEAKRIGAAEVDVMTGSGRNANIFRIFDAIAEDNKNEALEILDRLFDQGEDPIRMLGAFSMQLRRLAQTAHLVQRGVPFSEAAARVGIPPFARQGCEHQLRKLRPSIDRIYDWLLEADLGMKGFSGLSPQTLLERLVIRLSRKGDNERQLSPKR